MCVHALSAELKSHAPGEVHRVCARETERRREVEGEKHKERERERDRERNKVRQRPIQKKEIE